MLWPKSRLRIFALVVLLSCLSALAIAQTAAPSKQKEQEKQTASSAQSEPVDINTASKEQLEALPAIGTTYSQKIIDNRPYKRKDELVSKKVLPVSVFQKIRSKIIAKQ